MFVLIFKVFGRTKCYLFSQVKLSIECIKDEFTEIIKEIYKTMDSTDFKLDEKYINSELFSMFEDFDPDISDSDDTDNINESNKSFKFQESAFNSFLRNKLLFSIENNLIFYDTEDVKVEVYKVHKVLRNQLKMDSEEGEIFL